MKPIPINATDLRLKTRDLMERVKYHGDVFVIETFGRPMAIILSVEEYARLKELVANGSHAPLPSASKPIPSAKGLKTKTRRQSAPK